METLSPEAHPSPLSTMKCTGGLGASTDASNRTVRDMEMVTPSFTVAMACWVLAGVMRLGAPSWSSVPQRPQLDRDLK